MGISLESLKDLRSRGATVQMQEDLASFLDGGYDSDLFLPTIDFIIQLQNQAKGQSQDIDQQQSLDLDEFDIPEVYDPKYFDKISIKASGELMKASALEEGLKMQILAYLDKMEIQRAGAMGTLGGESSEMQHARAKISDTRRRDRGTKNTKSMFESLVSGLSALQVRFAQQNTNQKKHQDQVVQQTRLRDIIKQKMTQNSENRQDRKESKSAEKSFLKSMRRAFRLDKKNDNEGNSSDAQHSRMQKKEYEKETETVKAVSDVAHKYEQAQEQATKTAGEKSVTIKEDIKIDAAQNSTDTKKTENASKEQDGQKNARDDKVKSSRMQAKLQQVRTRLQQRQREESQRQQQDRAGKVDDRSAEKAVRALKNMGVSLSEGDASKVSNKELSQVAKLQEKQRGG